MTYRLKIGILAAICLGSFFCNASLRAQGVSEYSVLMQEADKLLAESNIDEARLRYAQALNADTSDTEKTHTGLFLAMTFERDGVFQEAECRDWAAKQFTDRQGRGWVERGIQEYRQKFLGELTLETTWEIKNVNVSATSSTASSDIAASNSGGVAGSSVLTNQWENFEKDVQNLIYTELIRRGEEMSLQDKQTEARESFAKALGIERKKNTLSQSAIGIVLSFQDQDGLDVDACKVWSKANIPVAEDRLRIELAVGEVFYRNQDYNEAILYLNGLVKKKGPIAEMGSLIIGLSLQAQRKYDEAVAQFKHVASKSSSDEIVAKAMFLIGSANLQAQQYPAAKAAFDNLIREYPKSPFAEKAIKLSERLKSYVE